MFLYFLLYNDNCMYMLQAILKVRYYTDVQAFYKMPKQAPGQFVHNNKK